MARTLTPITISAKFSALLKNAIDGSSGTPATRKHGADWTPATALSSGTTADKADRVWEDTERSLADTASENIDLADFGTLDIGAGAGLDALGQSLALAEIVALMIRNRPTSTGNLTVGAEGSAAAWNSINGSDTVKICTLSPGAWFQYFDPTDGGLPVADVTNHLLKMAAAGGALEYDIHILGRSA